MQEIDIAEFKANCLALIHKISKTKRSLRITCNGEPFVEIIPASSVSQRRNFVGSGKDTFDILDNDIVGPIIGFK